MTPRRVKDVLLVLALFGAVAAVLRLATGLGATTALSDEIPWGLWKVLNMIAGVALATGGFVMAFLGHVLEIRSLKPLVRPAILIAFLGYGASCAALVFDIGLPQRFWSPMLNWNIHSFLFEVFWCVLLYFTVTVIELGPIALENSRFPRLYAFFRKISKPVVILGITFSCLHHTSLGSLFLVSPTRLHEIWYTPWLPVHFILSAVGAGMLGVVLVTLLVARLYRRPPPLAALSRMGGGAAIVLGIYLVTKVVDLASRGALSSVVSGQWEGRYFLVEILTAAVLPIGLLAVPAVRRSAGGLAVAAALAAVGLAMNRLGAGVFGFLRTAETGYFPTLPELALTLGIPAAAGLFLLAFAERYRVFSFGSGPEPVRAPDPAAGFSPQTGVWRGVLLDQVERVTLIAVFVVPLGLALFTGRAGAGTAEPAPAGAPLAGDASRSVLRLDGDRDGNAVVFRHVDHQKRLGGSGSCLLCHHLDRPGDRATSCHLCHADMESPTRIFDHARHERKVAARDGFAGALAGNRSCGACHDPDRPRSRESARACMDCHAEDMRMADAPAGLRDLAPSLTDALHGSCVGCHEEKAEVVGRPDLGDCRTCHD